MSTITPELALVDPDLAAAARALLPEPGTFRSARSAQSEGGKPPALELLLPVSLESMIATPRRSRRRAVPTVVGVVPVVAAALALTITLLAPHVRGVDAAGEAVVTSPLTAPQTRAGRTYAWPDVPGARAYHVTVLRDQQPFFETTTTKPALELPTALELPPGRYTLSATPRSGSASSEPPGRPVLEETFVVESQ